MRGNGSFKPGQWLAMAGRKSPWGSGGSSGGNGGGGNGDEPPASGSGDGAPSGDPPPDQKPQGPRNPWLKPDDYTSGERRSANIEDIFRGRKKGPGGGGGGGGGFPSLPPRPDGKSWWPVILGGAALIWLLGSSTHQLSPKEQGIVTTFGKYSRTIGSGVNFTAPWPFQTVTTRDVTSVTNDVIPEGEGENLVLTSDQNLIDLSYQVRWNIKNLELFTFASTRPEETVREVAEAAMRLSVAEVPLRAVWDGTGRGQLEANTRRRMQEILDAYRTGVNVIGVDIKKADPPEKVADAFQKVNVAQQNAERDKANAQAWAQQTLARAEGEAAAFDKVYAEYRLSPQVTRQRMYYETMERVLSANDKVVVEANGVTPYLPLPELRRRAAEQPQQGGQ
jgi:membrane protease subunit HflK